MFHLVHVQCCFTATEVGGVTVSMVAFQAVDPGSTPGRRTFRSDITAMVDWA